MECKRIRTPRLKGELAHLRPTCDSSILHFFLHQILLEPSNGVEHIIYVRSSHITIVAPLNLIHVNVDTSKKLWESISLVVSCFPMPTIPKIKYHILTATHRYIYLAHTIQLRSIYIYPSDFLVLFTNTYHKEWMCVYLDSLEVPGIY
jgi:hypothetical protein